MSVVTVREGKRGCGWRKGGGLYLMSGGLAENCDRLPIVLDRCPTCDAGIKPTRGFTWIDGTKVAGPLVEHGDMLHRDNCPLQPYQRVTFQEKDTGALIDRHAVERAGLIWVGEAFYKTPEDFTLEATKMGVSRRIVAVPRGLVVGKTWIFLAHRKVPTQSYVCQTCAMLGDGETPVDTVLRTAATCSRCERGIQIGDAAHRVRTPAVFRLFRPQRIEYVVNGDESEEEIAALEKRGITCVKVERDEHAAKQEVLL